MIGRSESFKVTEFGTNGKHVCYFLLVNNSKCDGHVSRRLSDTATHMSKIVEFLHPIPFNAPTGVFSYENRDNVSGHKSIAPELHFCRK